MEGILAVVHPMTQIETCSLVHKKGAAARMQGATHKVPIACDPFAWQQHSGDVSIVLLGLPRRHRQCLEPTHPPFTTLLQGCRNRLQRHTFAPNMTKTVRWHPSEWRDRPCAEKLGRLAVTRRRYQATLGAGARVYQNARHRFFWYLGKNRAGSAIHFSPRPSRTRSS